MTNLIIVLILFLVAFLGIRSAVLHFRGQGGCCGGGGYKIRRKKQKSVLYKKAFSVDGMHCEKCKARVEEIVNDLPGLSGTVDLKKAVLTVSYAKETDDTELLSRLARAGYPASLLN